MLQRACWWLYLFETLCKSCNNVIIIYVIFLGILLDVERASAEKEVNLPRSTVNCQGEMRNQEKVDKRRKKIVQKEVQMTKERIVMEHRKMEGIVRGVGKRAMIEKRLTGQTSAEV